MRYVKFTTTGGTNLAIDLDHIAALRQITDDITEIVVSDGYTMCVKAGFEDVIKALAVIRFEDSVASNREEPQPIAPNSKLSMKKARLFELQLLKAWMGRRIVNDVQVHSYIETRTREIERGNY